MESVPRLMTRSTSPVFRLRCQRRLKLCRCSNSWIYWHCTCPVIVGLTDHLQWEESYLRLPRCVLLNGDPEKAAQIVKKTHSAHSAALEELDEDVDENELPGELDLAVRWCQAINCNNEIA